MNCHEHAHARRHRIRDQAQWLLPTALILLVCACQPTGDGSAPDRVTGNTASVFLAVDPAQETMEVSYEFETPIREFHFRYQPGPVRDGSWSVLDSEIVLDNGSIRRVDGGLIEQVRLGVTFDADWYDRVFPSLRPVGDAGLVFNTDYLMLDEIAFDSIRAGVAPGNVVAYSNFVSTNDSVDVLVHDLPADSGHYVYFGQEESILTFADGVIVSDAASTNRMLEQLRLGIRPAVEWLETFLRIESVDRVHVIATVDEASEITRHHGDVSDSGEIFLRFFGDGWNGENENQERNAERALYHELVHALSASGFQVGEGEPEWLWEGLAEYLALAYAGLYGRIGSPDWSRAQVQQRTSECIGTLEEERAGISDPPMLRGRDPYNCGVLAYWLMDGAADASFSGNQLRAVWMSTAEGFVDGDAEFGVASLLGALEDTGAVEELQLLRLLIDGPGGSDWQARDRLLSELGVHVAYVFDDAWARRALDSVVDHILLQQCGPGRIGYWTSEDHIQLDTDDRCGPLSGNPQVDRINGLMLLGEMREVFESVEGACRNGETIQFGVYESSETLTVGCSEPIVEVPPSATLTVDNQP